VIHEAVQKIMSEDPEAGVVGHEVAVRDEAHQVSGRADSLTRTAEGLEVPEYKTIDARAFRYGDLPYASHIFQDGTYITFYPGDGPFLFPPESPSRGRIVYIGLPGGRIDEYTIEATPELKAFVKSEYLRLGGLYATYQETGEVPPPLDAPKTDFRIKYCEYRTTGRCCGDTEDQW
jgi:hypothetical protein